MFFGFGGQFYSLFYQVLIKVLDGGILIMKQELLRLDWIAKSFDGIPMLRYINLNLYAGEIHALMGANGVGKSTLLRIIAGKLAPDSGSFYFCDQLVTSFNLLAARSRGVYEIERNPEIIPQFDLYENVAMQLRQEQKKLLYKQSAIRANIRFLIHDLKLETILRRGVSGYRMSVLEKQCMHILCAVANNARVLVFDEPFSTLDIGEAIALKALLRRIRARGISIFLASHSVSDIFDLADRVTILRAGCCAATFEPPHSVDQFSTMVMRYLTNAAEQPTPSTYTSHAVNRELFRVENCKIPGLSNPISFNIRAGEVLGIVTFGAFRTSVCEKIFGLGSRCTGSFLLEGKSIALGTPSDALRAGIGFMCDDEHYQEIVPNLPACQNMTLPHLKKLFPFCIPDPSVDQYLANQFQEFLLLEEQELNSLSFHLSCGMQKRLALARWFCVPYRLLMLSEPVKGLDATGQQQLKQMIQDRTCEGGAFVLESSAYDSLTILCDRILLINNYQVLGVLTAPGITQQTILSKMLSNSVFGGDFIV